MLDIFQEGVTGTLRAMSSGLKYPVMIILILLAAFTIFLLGTLIVEYIQEHRYLNVKMPALVDDIRSAGKGHVADKISESALLIRQKEALVEVTRHPELTDLMRESLAIRLIAEEQDFYDRRTRRSDLIAKVGPMFGLMGTLIPLGPGIIALGQGDTYTLSTSLLIAFDTTVAGLAVAAVALCISTIRKRWYNNYMSMLETLMECVLDEVKNEVDYSQAEQTPAPAKPAVSPYSREYKEAQNAQKDEIVSVYKQILAAKREKLGASALTQDFQKAAFLEAQQIVARRAQQRGGAANA
ncbi:MAG: MotA/TolQ/ExbB proton channel family protein [Bacillota bacterium]|nr:MotA/TolQ/ExbB proton channel family protein [Bacillota bacterium]